MAVLDRYDLAIEHLLNQFQNSTNFKKALRVAFNRVLDSEGGLDGLEHNTNIDDAEGVWLDILGRIVGLKRPAAEFDQDKIFTYGSLGPELLTDGDMESATTTPPWNSHLSAVLSKQTTSPKEGIRCLRVTYGGVSTGLAYQSVLTVGKTYRLVGWARSDGTALPVFYGAASPHWTGTTSTEWQKFDFTFSAEILYAFFGFISAGAGNYTEFDDVTLFEVQSVDPLKGYSVLNHLNDGSMELATAADWIDINSAALSKSTTNPKIGSRCLRVTYGGHSAPQAGQYPIVPGYDYRFKGWARSNGVVSPFVLANGSIQWTGTTSTEWQEFDISFTSTEPGGPWITMGCLSAGAGDYVEFDGCWVVTESNRISSFQIAKDGDMEDSGTLEWTAGGSAALSKQTMDPVSGSRCLRIAYGGASPFWAAQDITKIGLGYRFRGWARSDGAAIPRIHNGDSVLWTGTNSVEWQWFDISYKAPTATIALESGSGSGYVEFDDVFVNREGGYYQSLQGLPALDGSFMSDTDFRKLVKAKAKANFAIGTIPDIYTFVNTAFGLTPKVYRNATRSVAIEIGATISQNKKYLIETLGPRLAGVVLGVIE